MKTLRQATEADPEADADEEGSGFNVSNILFILFKHKWKIVVSTFMGLIAAAAVYIQWPRVYVSKAKLLVRYVVEKSAIDPESAGGGEA